MSDNRLQELEELLLAPERHADRAQLAAGDWASLVQEYADLRQAARREEALRQEYFGGARAGLLFGDRPVGPSAPGDLDPTAGAGEYMTFGGNPLPRLVPEDDNG